MKTPLYNLYAFIIAISLCYGASTPYFGEVSKLEGDVTLYRKLRPTPIQIEKDLLHRDRIKTDTNSMVLIGVYDGTELTVSPKTKMTLTRKDIKKHKNINLQLLSGTIRCKVKTLGQKESFVIKTPSAVVGVRGTDFITSYSMEDGLEVTVLEGKVEITALKEIQGKVRKQTIQLNDQIRMNDNFEFIEKRKLTPNDRLNIEKNYKF
ncbi:MAG: FecR domain-containing protein, partial [Planctomycetes bacterium]|nr:FecR domain-containing protein [Planctomycetota bacterium]